MPKSNWIDFKELRESLDFQEVLEYYGVEIKVKGKGNQHYGVCPLPNHGENKSPSFSANLKRGLFNCFGCGAGGNLLDFCVLMEDADLKDGKAVRRVARKIAKDLLPASDVPQTEKKEAESNQEPETQENSLPVVVNAPLDFSLKGLDSNHISLTSRGFTPKTISYFGLGFYSRGMLKDQIAISLHDQAGQLIGYAGGMVDDDLAGHGNFRYRFPPNRKRKGKVIEFQKTLFLYNGFRLDAPCDDLIAVCEFSSVWWLHQNGFPNTVALMGKGCSAKQAELIVSLVKPKGKVWVFSENSNEGEHFALPLISQVVPHRFVRWVRLENDCYITQMETKQLKTVLSF